MTTFDEAGRLALYSENPLDLLAFDRVAPPDQIRGRPRRSACQCLGPASRRDKLPSAMVGDLLTYLPGDFLVKVDLATMAARPGMPGAVPRPPGRRAGHRHATGPQASVSPGPLQGRAQTGILRPLTHADQNTPEDGFWCPDRPLVPQRAQRRAPGHPARPISLNRGLFRPESVRALVNDHIEGRREHGPRLWALYAGILVPKPYRQILPRPVSAAIAALSPRALRHVGQPSLWKDPHQRRFAVVPGKRLQRSARERADRRRAGQGRGEDRSGHEAGARRPERYGQQPARGPSGS